MVIRAEMDDIFESKDDGSIAIADDAPTVLTNALQEAKRELTPDTEFVVQAVGEERRPLDFGIDDFAVIQTDTASIFAGSTPDSERKILALGVSHNGSLSETQVQDALIDLSEDAILSAEEISETRDVAAMLRSMRQARLFVKHNRESLKTSADELINGLREERSPDEIMRRMDILETHIHNFLSSIYTFTETVEQTLKSVGILGTTKHRLQKYEDQISVAIGLRHYVQHKSALKVQWLATYDHDQGRYNFKVGIPKTEVWESELYHPTKDAAGETRDPLEYYYGDVDSYLIDVLDMCDEVWDSTEHTYDQLKGDLEGENIEEVEILNKFFRIKEHSLRSIFNEKYPN